MGTLTRKPARVVREANELEFSRRRVVPLMSAPA